MSAQSEIAATVRPDGAEPQMFDAVALLTAYLAFLMLVPSPWVVGAVGSAGTPATLLALAGGYAWCWRRVQYRGRWTDQSQPVRNASLAFLLALLVVYVHATLGPIEQADVSAADNGMLRAAGWVAVLVVANDGIRDASRLRVMLARLTLLGTLVAFVALLQFVTRDLLVDRLEIPGLALNSPLLGLAERNGLPRVPGTGLSPIELGVVLAMILPAAVTFALSGRRPVFSWIALGTLSVAIFFSISRAALLAALVAVLCMLPVWRRSVRWWALGFGVAAFALVYVSAPGLLGAIRTLFVGISTDPSALSRTDSYDVAGVFISRSPLLGRGFGTFVPDYRILDNQWLLLVVETGVLGLVTFAALLGTSLVVARRARLLMTSEMDRQLAQSILAGLAAGSSGMLFFDGFSFPMVAGVLFFLIGLSGAAWRIARISGSRGGQSDEPSP